MISVAILLFPGLGLALLGCKTVAKLYVRLASPDHLLFVDSAACAVYRINSLIYTGP